MDDQNSTPTGSPPENGSDAVSGPEESSAVAVVGALVVAGENPEVFGSETGVVVKRKRGRPRKYNVNGDAPPAPAPERISDDPSSGKCVKRGRGRPRGSGKLQHLASIGGVVADTAGGGFTPHVVTVNTGEDVVSRISLFSLRGPRAICILSATGAGRFEIISLSGSYTAGGISGGRRKSGMLSVSLAKPDGKVFGGGVEGALIAAGPIQLIVGSFKQNISREIKRRHSVGCSAVVVAAKTTEEEADETTTNGLYDDNNNNNNVVVPATHSMTSASLNDGLTIDIDISEPQS
ncbi:AT-hook motif nuclear-localized protein 11-like isoform X1 [Senna tora]|uniref:AT-hook motif nuclear-localized protein n=1 Tax=Senna tora TaxID=362788 RepID=A0A834TLU9_9FABA|nr:AT-hook motif nuclear-localized protein 11-like isoform X1 [Senna tora]